MLANEVQVMNDKFDLIEEATDALASATPDGGHTPQHDALIRELRIQIGAARQLFQIYTQLDGSDARAMREARRQR